jgi:hypothetical protein
MVRRLLGDHPGLDALCFDGCSFGADFLHDLSVLLGRHAQIRSLLFVGAPPPSLVSGRAGRGGGGDFGW